MNKTIEELKVSKDNLTEKEVEKVKSKMNESITSLIEVLLDGIIEVVSHVVAAFSHFGQRGCSGGQLSLSEVGAGESLHGSKTGADTGWGRWE